ncbi:hypothetical protein BofuT4_uP146570.1 [Botrytis cinerea T4]|uniref:Uncharacterized protein n=1 Tax=Botryotinia fuckeliana (strain T4) TaxID=999810 RepID=G2YXZ0_BOTF4|nr:hypothetical protein BofuT4_uP094700.1 [Botrytis cinerea T4]CCD56488.1 hypothetical protein BofuT4_uP146570.1 [Botrytis cinerea T4]
METPPGVLATRRRPPRPGKRDHCLPSSESRQARPSRLVPTPNATPKRGRGRPKKLRQLTTTHKEVHFHPVVGIRVF